MADSSAGLNRDALFGFVRLQTSICERRRRGGQHGDHLSDSVPCEQQGLHRAVQKEDQTPQAIDGTEEGVAQTVARALPG